jgi:predicted adenylyl cyclase CyaB
MPTNIEIKARVPDPQALQARAEALSQSPVEIIEQEDTFFNVPGGRLKLRWLSPTLGQLIYYTRADQSGPKQSHYRISQTPDPASLQSVLAEALGVRGVVRKRRRLYMVGHTRVHLDEVQGLGSFMELEVVLQPGQTPAEGEQIAARLMQQLGIRPDDLVQAAYMDLLEADA